MRLLNTLVFLFLTVHIIGQNKKVDSIATSMSNKAWDQYEKQSDSTLIYADMGITYSKQNNSSFGLVLNLEVKGVYYEEVKNDFKTASKIYFEAIEIAEKKQPKLVSSLYNNLCIMYMLTDYKKSVLYGKKAVANSSIIKGSKSEAKAYVNLGIAQSLLKDYEDANKNLEYFLNLKVLNQYEKNIAYLRIAKNYKAQGLYKKAQPMFLKIIALDSLKGQRQYFQDYIQLIKNAAKLNDINIIKRYSPVLMKNISTEKNMDVKREFYEVMTDVYKILNQPKQALEYQNKLINIKDSLTAKKYNKQIVELETKYQTKKKEEQITKEQNKKKLWVIISMGAFIALSFVALLLYKNHQKRKQLNNNKIELEKLLNQRNMLLRETHHRVKNSFQMVSSLLQLQAEGSEAEVAIKALENAVQRVNSMIVLHQQLYAKNNLLGINLKIYIDDLITEILNSYPLENINIKTNIDATVLNIETATSIGLLVNELATNSIKYAWNENTNEKIITLTINVKNNNFVFKMYDNGIIKKTSLTKENYGSELIEILIERLEANKEEFNENDFGLHLTFKNNNG